MMKKAQMIFLREGCERRTAAKVDSEEQKLGRSWDTTCICASIELSMISLTYHAFKLENSCCAAGEQ